MASISAGTRNLRFMQRGKQLPDTPSTPAQASSSLKTATPSAQLSVQGTQPAAADSSRQEEEEQWVLPSRIRSLSKGKGKSPPGGSSAKDHARPRVVVVKEASYLPFVGFDSHAEMEQGQSSEDDEMNGGGVIANGRLSFGTLPAKQTLDTSIVDNREKMSHAKATTTSADRFAVFASTDKESSSSRRKGNGEEHSKRSERKTEQRRPIRDTQTSRDTTEKGTSSSTSARPTRQGFLRPSNYDDIPQPSRSQPISQQDDAPATSSKRSGKKRKSDQRTGDGEEEEDDVLVQGARARGKRSKKQAKGIRTGSAKAKGKGAEMDEDAMVAEIAGGAVDDEEVERYLEGVMEEMRDD